MLFVVSPPPKKGVVDVPHTAYAAADNRRIRQSAYDLSAFRTLIKGIQARTVLELYSGAGWHSAAIQDIVRPRKHIALDYSADCVKSVDLSLKDVDAIRADSYAVMRRAVAKPRRVDWIHADFPQFSPCRAVSQPKYKGVLEGIFVSAQKYVTITDSAYFGVIRFPQNMAAYTRLFGAEVDKGNYLEQVSRHFFFKRFGWSIVRAVTWQSMCAGYVLMKRPPRRFKVVEQKAIANVKKLGLYLEE